MDVTVQICPDSSELCEIKTNIPCSVEGCSAIFSNTPNLEMHLIKIHHKSSCYLDKKASNITFQYFCPVNGCKYALNLKRKLSQRRWFSKMKFLKQHYMKVHLQKTISCNSCERKFVTIKERNWHVDNECGKKFSCLVCNAEYKTRISLITHCRRKSHPVQPLLSRKVRVKKMDLICNGYSVKNRPILPKMSLDSSVDIAAEALSQLSRKIVVRGVDKGVQTVGKRRRSGGSGTSRKNASLQTHSGPRICAETQTTAVYPNKKQRRLSNRAKSMQTQTLDETDNAVDSEYLTLSDFTSDIVLPNFWEKKNETSTQTNPPIVFDMSTDLNLNIFSNNPSFDKNDNSVDLYSENIDRLIQQSTIFDDTRSCNIETQTELELDSLMDDCPILSNTETQTIQATLNDIYSNNYTQTCDEGVFDGLVEFADIETQTGYPFILPDSVSTCTQTIF